MFKTKKTRPDTENGLGTFSSSDVSRIAQVSLRQLQWWDERKVVSPRHEGHKRVYLAEEVIEITVIAELRRKGFSLQKIRRVLSSCNARMIRLRDRHFAALPAGHSVRGYSDGLCQGHLSPAQFCPERTNLLAGHTIRSV